MPARARRKPASSPKTGAPIADRRRSSPGTATTTRRC